MPRQFENDHPRHIVAVMGVVTDGRGRLLLVKGHRRGWEPPGGQVELGETLDAALRREIREESGCSIEVDRLVGVYSNLGRPEKGVPEQINLTFACNWTDGEPSAGDECTDAGWFSIGEALQMVESPQQSGKLHDALGGPQGVTYRSYRTLPYEILHERTC